jgi:GNAT superfamily N-acetyltransferase
MTECGKRGAMPDQMSIEIDILTGEASRAHAQQLLDTIWPPASITRQPWGHLAFANPDLRVLLEADGELVCHVGIVWRDATWNGRKVRIGGIGSVATRQDARRQGYASVALDAAIRTFRDERATDFAMLFCATEFSAFYQERGWRAFAGEVFAQQPGGRAILALESLRPHILDIRRAPREGVIDLCGSPW